ncbi:hypothetical protein FXO38_20895 [Capsicum annuum]|nr:hypothetical protein FXO38_20895 [Capsicum annuum]KAF3672337.1 hypothetical protein FXO37_07560 [Capsicum annuum]
MKNHHDQSLGYEILHVGFLGNTNFRRAVKVPTDDLQKNERNYRNSKRTEVFFRNGVDYWICFVETAALGQDDIDVLDMKNDSYIGPTTFPKVATIPSEKSFAGDSNLSSEVALTKKQMFVVRHSCFMKYLAYAMQPWTAQCLLDSTLFPLIKSCKRYGFACT